MDLSSPFITSGDIYSEMFNDVSPQLIPAPIVSDFTQEHPSHDLSFPEFSLANVKGRDCQDSDYRKYDQLDGGEISIQSTGEDLSVWDRYDGPSFSSSTDFGRLSSESRIQEPVGNPIEKDSANIPAAVNDSLSQRSAILDVKDVSNYDISRGLDQMLQQLNSENDSNSHSHESKGTPDAGLFRFDDQVVTSLGNFTSMPLNAHHPNPFKNVPQTRPFVVDTSSRRLAQTCVTGVKRPRLNPNEGEEEDWKAFSMDCPVLTPSDPNEEIQPLMKAMLSLWHAANPNRLPRKRELKALKLVTQASGAAILHFFRSTASTTTGNPVVDAAPLSALSLSPPDPENICVAKKRSNIPWNKARDPEKVYSCTRKCGSTFTKKGDWIRHELINCPQYSWACTLLNCAAMFGRKDKLRDHIKTVHDINPDTFDLASARTCLAHQFFKLCGFCGYSCTSWQEWTNHIGAHFEDRIAGGPWEMCRWKDPWLDDGADQNTEDESDDDDDSQGSDHDDNQSRAPDSTSDADTGFSKPHHSAEGSGRSGTPSNSSNSAQFGGSHNFGPTSGDSWGSSLAFRPVIVGQTSFGVNWRSSSGIGLVEHRDDGREKRRDLNTSASSSTIGRVVPKLSTGSLRSSEPSSALKGLVVTRMLQRAAHNAQLEPYLEDSMIVLNRQQSANAPKDKNIASLQKSRFRFSKRGRTLEHRRAQHASEWALVKQHGLDVWVRILMILCTETLPCRKETALEILLETLGYIRLAITQAASSMKHCGTASPPTENSPNLWGILQRRRRDMSAQSKNTTFIFPAQALHQIITFSLLQRGLKNILGVSNLNEANPVYAESLFQSYIVLAMVRKDASQRPPSREVTASTLSSKTAIPSTRKVNVNCIKDLTEENLASYQTSLNESTTEAWINHLIREESCRNFFSELGKSRKVISSDFGVTDEPEDLYDSQFRLSTETPNDEVKEPVESIDMSLKMFTPLPFSLGDCLPLERSLTPGFCDPTYFAKSALTDMKILHGDSLGISERAHIAKMNVQLVLETKPKKKSSIKTTLS